ncbi:hypothetical protein [Azospirillum doebereinerae]
MRLREGHGGWQKRNSPKSCHRRKNIAPAWRLANGHVRSPVFFCAFSFPFRNPYVN